MHAMVRLTLLVLVTAFFWSQGASKSLDDVELDEKSLKRVKRIVGMSAEEIRTNDWPWLVHLKAEVCVTTGSRKWWCLWICGQKKKCKTVTCGGSIINSRYILTAAHCADDDDSKYRSELRKSKKFHVTSGEVDWKCSTGDYIRHLWARLTGNVANRCHIHATSVSFHPQYNRGSASYWNYDFALMRLEANILDNDNTGVIDLPPPGTGEEWPADRQIGYVHGWGCSQVGGRPSARARNTVIGARSSSFCRAVYGSRYDTATHICAGGNGTSVCSGDSGGPLVHEMNGQFFQSGVVSFFVQDRATRQPSGFARVSAATPWIRSVITGV